MKKLLLLLLCTCMQAAFAQSGKIDWKADLKFLTKELPEKHCNFFTARSKGEFASGIEAIKAESERLTDFQVALKTQQLIARFGDSHTMLQFFRSAHYGSATDSTLRKRPRKTKKFWDCGL